MTSQLTDFQNCVTLSLSKNKNEKNTTVSQTNYFFFSVERDDHKIFTQKNGLLLITAVGKERGGCLDITKQSFCSASHLMSNTAHIFPPTLSLRAALH